MQNIDFRTTICNSLWFPDLTYWFCAWQNSVLIIQNYKLVYGSQTSPVVLCVQNSDFSTRITSLYETQPSSMLDYANANQRDFMTRINAYLWVPVLNLWYLCTAKLRALPPESLVSMGPRPSYNRFVQCKTVCLAPKLQVSMGPRPHLSILCMQNSVLSIGITSLKGSLSTSSVVLYMQNKVDFRTRITKSLWVLRPSPAMVVACKTEWLLHQNYIVSMVPSPHLWFCAFKTSNA